MNENIDYGDTELRAMLEGERRFRGEGILCTVWLSGEQESGIASW